MTDIDGLRAEAPGMETTAEEREFGMGMSADAAHADCLRRDVARLSAALAEAERKAAKTYGDLLHREATAREAAARAEERERAAKIAAATRYERPQSKWQDGYNGASNDIETAIRSQP